jgi:O-antigen/teichoic acid export membrane protein
MDVASPKAPILTDTSATLTAADARRAARNAGAIALAQIVSKGTLFVWQIILIPLLGLTAYGVYGTVAALFLVAATVAAFGIGTIVTRDVARQPTAAGRYLTATLFLQTLFSLLAYVGMNAAAWLLGYETDVRAYVAIAALSLFIDQLGSIFYDQLLARERMVTISLVDILMIVGRVALTALLLWAGWGLLGVYIATLSGGILRALLLGAALWRSGVRPTFPLDRMVARGLLRDGTPVALGTVVGQAYSQMDRLLTATLISVEAVGHLSVPLLILTGMTELLSSTVLIAVFPLMSRVYSPDEATATFRKLVEKLAFFTLLVTLPVTLCVSLFAHALPQVFGADYIESVPVLRALAWYGLLAMVANVYALALLVQNRQSSSLFIRGGGLLLHLALLLALLPRIGIVGAPLASLLSQALVLAALVWLFRRGAQVNAAPAATQLARLLVAGALAAAVMLTLGGVHVLVGAAAGLGVYAGAVLALGVLGADDWALIRGLKRKG